LRGHYPGAEGAGGYQPRVAALGLCHHPLSAWMGARARVGYAAVSCQKPDSSVFSTKNRERLLDEQTRVLGRSVRLGVGEQWNRKLT